MANTKSKSRSAGYKDAMDVDGVENAVELTEDDEVEVNGYGGGEGEGGEEGGDEEGEDEGEYEVENILDHKMQSGKYVYLVSWKGYGPEHNTWEPEMHVDHAEDIVRRYWDEKPKTGTKPMGTSKRGRPSNGASSSRGGARRGGVKRKQDEEDDVVEDYEETYVDSTAKYEDVRDWEDLVASVDTIERGKEDILMVYMTMTGGEKVAHAAEVVYRRCPQKVLKFYEAHLKWKVSE